MYEYDAVLRRKCQLTLLIAKSRTVKTWISFLRFLNIFDMTLQKPKSRIFGFRKA